jgi:hypothetical protein
MAAAIDSGEANCKEIVQSAVHKNLNRDNMLKDAWWLQYCICKGTALGTVGDPYFGAESRNLCIHEKCECADFGSPFCSNIAVECCITSQCSFPKIDGSPVCVCCNKKLAGEDGSKWKPKLFTYEFDFKNQFWLYYFLCAGVSVHGCQANGRPILGFQVKEFCIQEEGKCTAPIQGGVLCSGVSTTLCCWNQCQFPPNMAKQPKFACCGFKIGGEQPSSKPSPFAYGKPSQVEMK